MATPFTNAKDSGKVSSAELERFACCFLHTKDGVTDWDAAAADYDAKVKVASFKTVTLRAIKKVLAAGEAGSSSSTAGATPAVEAGGKGAKKRNAVAETAGAEPEAKKAATKAKGKGGRKTKKGEGDFRAVNGEEGEGEGEDGDEIRVGVKSKIEEEEIEDGI